MAKLTGKNFHEVGRIRTLTYDLAYMSDGRILENHGYGWKESNRKLKTGITPLVAYEHMVEFQKEQAIEKPAYTEYRETLIKYCGQKRERVHTAIQLMPDDPDAIYIEFQDTYDYQYKGIVNFDEVEELCRLYKAAIAEKEINTL